MEKNTEHHVEDSVNFVGNGKHKNRENMGKTKDREDVPKLQKAYAELTKYL